MHVLVTGAAGKLGEIVVRQLLEEGHEVVGLDRQQSESLPTPVVFHDLRERSGLLSLLDGVDAVVHAAADPGRGQLTPGDTWKNNVESTLNLVEACSKAALMKFVYTSSIQVIAAENAGEDGPPQVAYLPLDGDSPANPHGEYSFSKAVGETITRTLLRDSEIQCVTLRFPWLVPSLSGRTNGRPLKPRWRREKRFVVEQGFSFLSLGDAARLVAACVRAPLPGYRAFLPALCSVPPRLLPQYIRRHYRHVPLRKPLEDMRSLIDLSTIERDTGWVPQDVPPSVADRRTRR